MPDSILKKKLKRRIMNSVFRSWFLRSVVPLFIVEIIIIVIAVYFFANLIFVGKVVDNALIAALGNPFKLIGYLWQSFLRTSAAIQVIIVALAVSAGLLLRDVNRGLISYLIIKKNEILEK
ncbi:MAG TPA: hypothetical protein VJB92_04015 [Candidatus Paceibacterota bacterium]